MAQEQIYDSSELIFDAENQSLSDDKLNDGRSDEEEEEDELTRKIKAIPILPRIPKIKKSLNACDEESAKSVLEHRSVLHRKEFFMNTEDSLKWPSVDVHTYDRHKKRNFNHSSETKTHNDHPNGSFQSRNRGSTCTTLDRKRVNGRNFTKSLTAEEKFDQITSKKDSEINHTNEIIPINSGLLSENEKTSSEFERHENSLLNTMTIRPYQTLEERRQERIRKGLLQSTTEIPASSNSITTAPPESLGNTVNKALENNQSLHSNIDDCNQATIVNESQSKESSVEINTVDGSSVSSDLDSQTEVIDMEIVNSPCEVSSKDSSKVKTTSNRKVTFDCPESIEQTKVDNASTKRDSKKKISENHSKQVNLQDEVVSIMKDFLKPFYSKQKISKDDYKEIMRKVVPKFSKNRKEGVRKDKVEHYAEKYVKTLLRKKNK